MAIPYMKKNLITLTKTERKASFKSSHSSKKKQDCDPRLLKRAFKAILNQTNDPVNRVMMKELCDNHDFLVPEENIVKTYEYFL